MIVSYHKNSISAFDRHIWIGGRCSLACKLESNNSQEVLQFYFDVSRYKSLQIVQHHSSNLARTISAKVLKRYITGRASKWLKADSWVQDGTSSIPHDRITWFTSPSLALQWRISDAFRLSSGFLINRHSHRIRVIQDPSNVEMIEVVHHIHIQKFASSEEKGSTCRNINKTELQIEEDVADHAFNNSASEEDNENIVRVRYLLMSSLRWQTWR